MEEDVLLDMYRSSWDEFLEAYKEKMDQNEALIKLVDEAVKLVPEDNQGVIFEKLGKILETP